MNTVPVDLFNSLGTGLRLFRENYYCKINRKKLE